MLVGFMSDSHRNLQAIDEVVAKHPEVTMWVHAGDNYDDGEYLAIVADVPVKNVIGNTDWPSTEAKELVFDILGYRVFLTHGDMYGVNFGLERIKDRARELNCKMVVFGHTHVGLVVEEDEMVIINPGSVSRPRDGKAPSYMIGEFSLQEPVKITRYYLD